MNLEIKNDEAHRLTVTDATRERLPREAKASARGARLPERIAALRRIGRRVPAALGALVLAGRVAMPVHAETPLDNPIPQPVPRGPLGAKLQPLATGLTAPNWGTFAPGDPSRRFVTDQHGILWAIELATGRKTVFADLRALLVPLGAFSPGGFDERGLLGVAFHPDYATNGLLYT